MGGLSALIHAFIIEMLQSLKLTYYYVLSSTYLNTLVLAMLRNTTMLGARYFVTDMTLFDLARYCSDCLPVGMHIKGVSTYYG